MYGGGCLVELLIWICHLGVFGGHQDEVTGARVPIRYGFILATLSAAGLVAVLVMRPTWEAAGGGAWPTAALVAAGVGLAVGIVWGIVALQRE